MVFRSIVSQLAKPNEKFMYGIKRHKIYYFGQTVHRGNMASHRGKRMLFWVTERLITKVKKYKRLLI